MERAIVTSPISKSLPCISECAHNTEKQYDPFQIPASNLKKHDYARSFCPSVPVDSLCFMLLFYVACCSIVLHLLFLSVV